MRIGVNGTTLWFDVEGPALVPAGRAMRERPTIVLVHGGPGGYDHSYFKPRFSRLAEDMQVVYLDLREHGRSARGDAAAWTFEACADDVRALCDALGIERPIVLGHSMGGFIAQLYGARHPGHPAGLILLSTVARWDHDRLVESFRRAGGDDVAEIASRAYSGGSVSADEWARVYERFGPNVPDADTLARRVRNPEVGAVGGILLERFDVVDQLRWIDVPTLVVVGDRDGPTPVECSREILEGLSPGIGRLEILQGAGHFSWLDDPDRLFDLIRGFVAMVSNARASSLEPT